MIRDADIRNASILIVDDQKANVQLLEQMLCDAGYRHVTSTMDPHAVCAQHHSNHYDLILLERMWPSWCQLLYRQCSSPTECRITS